MKNIVFFCSASKACPAEYNISAAKIIEGLCNKGYGIVSGGTRLGTMGVISNTVVKCGGYHKGVLPRFMKDVAFPGLSEVVWTETMSERKEEMRRDTVAAIALPGGIGTLDELIETHVLVKLQQYHGRVIVLNIDGFFNPFLQLLDHYVATGMLTVEDRRLVESFDTVDSLLRSFPSAL